MLIGIIRLALFNQVISKVYPSRAIRSLMWHSYESNITVGVQFMFIVQVKVALMQKTKLFFDNNFSPVCHIKTSGFDRSNIVAGDCLILRQLRCWRAWSSILAIDSLNTTEELYSKIIIQVFRISTGTKTWNHNELLWCTHILEVLSYHP